MVSDYVASREYNRFSLAAKPGQKLFFWAQVYHYGMCRSFTARELLRQAGTFAFLNPGGGVLYHEAMNFEEDEAGLFRPVSEFFRTGGE